MFPPVPVPDRTAGQHFNAVADNHHKERRTSTPEVFGAARRGVIYKRPILITAEKRAERDRCKPKGRRVHFKAIKTKQKFNLGRTYDDVDPFIQGWRRIMVIPLTYEVWAFPFRLALGFPSISSGIFYGDIICDVFFAFDVQITLRTTVAATDDKKKATTINEIAYHYFVTKFLFERVPAYIYLIAIPICTINLADRCKGSAGPFPADLSVPTKKSLLGEVRQQDFVMSDCFLEWPIWFWWVATFIRFGPRAVRFWRYSKEMEFNLDVSFKKVQIFYISMVIFMTSHWVGCCFFFIARLRYADDTTWLSDMELLLPLYDSYLSPMSSQYVVCLYNGFSSLTNMGYATFVPNNLGEILFSFIVMIIQLWQTGVIFGTVINYMNERDPTEEAHKQLMEDLHSFMDSKQLPQDLSERVVRHFEFQHKKAVENQSSNIDLPKSLEIKVANSKFRNVVAGCVARGQVLYGCNPQFMNAFLTKLRIVFVMPNEEVFKKNDLSRELCLVFQGACNVMNDEKVKHVVRYDVPEQSSILGEIPFFFGTIHRFHVRAYPDGDVQLLVLSRADGDELFNNFPEQLDIIRSNILAGIGLDPSGNSMSLAGDEEEEDPDMVAIKGDIREALKSQADETFTALTYAARSGDLEEVSTLLRRGAQINHVDYDGRGAFAMAAVEGNFKIVELLLQEGVDKNVRNRWGQTVLQEAMVAKQGPVVELLMQWKVFINSEQAGTALCSAASLENIEQLKRLVEKKADVNAGDYESRTALHVASAEGHARAVAYLLDQRADPNKKDLWGNTPLAEAVRAGKLNIIKVLQAKGGRMPVELGAAYFAAGAIKGDISMMHSLKGCGVKGEDEDYDSRFPLHIATAEGRLIIVSFLIGMSTDPNCTDRWGNTPLDDACKGGTIYHKYCARLLLDWGGRFGSSNMSPSKECFLKEVEQISHDDIRKAMGRIIARITKQGLAAMQDQQESRFVFETTVAHLSTVKELQTSLAEAARTLSSTSTILSESMDRILRQLRPMCTGIDSHPAKKRRPMSIPWLSAAAPQVGSANQPGNSDLLAELNALLAQQQTACFDGAGGGPSSGPADDASDGEDDAQGLDSDEEAQLHAELDVWIQMQERMEVYGGNQHKHVATIFYKACLQINDIEEMFRNLASVFRVASECVGPNCVPAVTLREFATVLELLRMPVSQCDLEEMFDEGLFLVPVSPYSKTTRGTCLGNDTESRFDLAKVGFTAFVAASDAFRHKIMALETDEVFCEINGTSSMPFISENQKHSLARGGRKRNVAKGEVFLSQAEGKTLESEEEAESGQDSLGFWVVVLSGSFVVEEDPRHLEERLYTELGPGDVFGGYAVLTGVSTPFSIKVVKGGQILELKQEHLVKLCKDSENVGGWLAKMMGEAPRTALKPGSDHPWNKPRSVKSETTSFDVWQAQLIKRRDNSQQQLHPLPQMQVHVMKHCFIMIENVWKEVSMGESTIGTSQVLAIENYLGEVGSELFKKMFAVRELPEVISKNQFWDIWMNFLTNEEYPERANEPGTDSKADSIASQDADKVPVAPLAESAKPDIIERLHARFARSRRLKRLFFDDDAIVRYEPAFVSLTGDVGTPLTPDNVVAFLEQLFPNFPYRISSYNCHEFLLAFGHDGARSRCVTFADIRKVLKEHEALASDVDQAVLLRGALNPDSGAYRRWLQLARLLAIYHFAVVPVRIAFLPWPSMLDARALSTDLPADILTAAHFVVLANTAFRNGKAQLVTGRLRLLRRVSLMLILAIVPLDWFGYGCGAPNGVCCWLRLPKLLVPLHEFRQLKPRGRASTAHRMAGLFLYILSLLHMTACGWFYVGTQYSLWFPGRGVTWYEVQPALKDDSIIDHAQLLGMEPKATVWEQYLVSFYCEPRPFPCHESFAAQGQHSCTGSCK